MRDGKKGKKRWKEERGEGRRGEKETLIPRWSLGWGVSVSVAGVLVVRGAMMAMAAEVVVEGGILDVGYWFV